MKPSRKKKTGIFVKSPSEQVKIIKELWPHRNQRVCRLKIKLAIEQLKIHRDQLLHTASR